MANDIALAQLYVNLDKWGREKLVDPSGIEPLTSSLPAMRSPS